MVDAKFSVHCIVIKRFSRLTPFQFSMKGWTVTSYSLSSKFFESVSSRLWESGESFRVQAAWCITSWRDTPLVLVQ